MNTTKKNIAANILLAGTPTSYPLFGEKKFKKELANLRPGGYIIRELKMYSGRNVAIVANDDAGVF